MSTSLNSSNKRHKKSKTASLAAAGAYLQYLRIHSGMTPTEAAAAAGTDASLLSRIENGKTDTRGSLLLKLTSVLGGSPEHITFLITSENLTVEDGIKLAQEWITERG